MKKIFLLSISLILLIVSFGQDGKYAGPALKKLVGKTFHDEKKIAGLKGYTFMEGTLITPIDVSESMTVDVYIKGSGGVVLFNELTDTVNMIFTILDVLEIKTIPKGWQVKTGVCSEGQAEGGVDLVALVNPGKKEKVKLVSRAWRCNRDKRRIESISAKNITCLNEGAEQF